jgi:hypothetical protein
MFRVDYAGQVVSVEISRNLNGKCFISIYRLLVSGRNGGSAWRLEQDMAAFAAISF